MPVETSLRKPFYGFMLGAVGMFATMYSTQAILPELSRDFDVSAAQAGLTVSVVVLAVGTGGYLWGPLSDRIGRPRAIRLASILLVPPTIAVALAPTFGVLVLCRLLQGLCMPGLLIVGAPYVFEVFVPAIGARAMGLYTAALTVGGLVGRLGVGLASVAVGWRVAVGVLALFPLAAALAMRRGLPSPRSAPRRGGGITQHLRNLRLLGISVGGASFFFAFVGIFSFITYRLQDPPFDYSQGVTSLVFVLWLTGLLAPLGGRLAERTGWRRLVLGVILLIVVGVALTLSDAIALVLLGLTLVAGAMFSGFTGLQLGLADTVRVDRGAATAIFYSLYYMGGALGGYLPGLAWEAWGWPGVSGTALAGLAIGGVCVAAAGMRRPRAAA